MAKTLVINGADFSVNKVTTVSYGGNVPCTGISLEESSVSLTDYDPVELEYTVTPSNTTDLVSWSSSDSTVVTVSNGVITPVGIGTATVTVSCGNQSASCTVEVSIAYAESYQAAMNTILYTSTTPNVVSTGSSGYRFTATGTGNQETTFKSVMMSQGMELHGVKLPANTVAVRISRYADKGSMFGQNNNHFIWTKDEWSGNTTSGYQDSIKPIENEDFYFNSDASKIFAVPEGADSFYLCMCFDNKPSDFDVAIQESGFMIEFLSELENA